MFLDQIERIEFIIAPIRQNKDQINNLKIHTKPQNISKLAKKID